MLWASIGAGTIGYAWVYSYSPDSDFAIFDVNRGPLQPRGDFVAFSDNGAGDYYGWRVADGKCHGAVLVLDHESGTWARSDATLSEWLERCALRPA